MTNGSQLPRLRRVRRAVAVLAILAGIAPTTRAQDLPKRAPTRQSNLVGAYAPSSVWWLDGNRAQCGIDNQGNLCVNHWASPYGGGGFWPDVPNEYVFNSGLQIAAIVGADGGPWARDTVGTYFFDARGTQPQGQRVTDIYSSAAPDHLAVWPAEAVIRDPQLFDPSYLGRRAISAEDSWVRYWDGPTLLSGRDHGMGVLVEQRSLQFGYPAGNEDILYWVFTLTNITASDPAAYAGLDPAVRDEVAALGAKWVAETEARVGVDLPPAGVRFDSLYVGLGMDADVASANLNASTAFLPFDASVTYESDFTEPRWRYPLEIAAPPFGPRPGFVGTALLRTPVTQTTGAPPGMTAFSTVTGSSIFPDPRGVAQLWRYLSVSVSAAEGDGLCNVADAKERRLCFLRQQPDEIRYFQSTGPFSLDPGESATIIMAYVFAGAVDSVVAPLAGAWLSPGIPPSGADLAAGRDTIRTIDRAAGWLAHTDANGDGTITPEEVQTVPRSLLAKVQLARALAAHGFLLPTAPAAPEFFLVPDDNRVTIVWKASATEATGDPYFALASDPTSALWDPNFRQFDVEGYRIYRGRRPDQLQLLAQFGYAGTTFVDYTGALDYGQGCAPELGITDRCPAFPVTVVLNGGLTQVPPGGRVLVGDNLVVIQADTVRDLRDTGVPFGFIDTGVQNFYPYYYAVTAFDVNSIASGPSSLESPIVAKSVVPRRSASNVGQAVVISGLFGRDRQLDPTATFTFDGATGRFTGPPPPTNALQVLGYDLFAPAALKVGAKAELRVDSVVPSYYAGTFYLTLDADGQTSAVELYTDIVSSHDLTVSTGPQIVALPSDPAAAAATGQAGLPRAGNASFQLTDGAITFYSGDAEWHYDVDGAFWTSDHLQGLGGSRWFSGNDESMNHPTGTATTVLRGQLPGVNTIYSPQPYINASNVLFRRNRQATWHAARQADVKFYWGATPGTLDSVVDVTDNVLVSFNASTNVQAGWGFRDDIAGTSTSYTPPDGVVTEYDFGHGPCYVDRPTWSSPGCETRPFRRQATLQPVDIDGDLAPEGSGFALYFNHEFYIFQTDVLPSRTVWTHRSYFGNMAGSPGALEFTPKPANAAVPGLTARLVVDAAATLRTVTATDLERVHTVPDPFYVTSHLGDSPAQRVLKFVNLPDRAIIRIYSLSGVLVTVIEHDDPSLGGEATWDLRNRNGRVVASGVYFYHVETPDGAERIGRMTLVIGGSYAIPRE